MKTLEAPLLTKEAVVAIALRALQARNWPYDEASGLQATWRGLSKGVLGQENTVIALWSVSFLTPAGPFEQEEQFVEIDDKTRRPLGIMTAHNYFFL